ncbi:MAG: type I restriction-modification enzyme R subunit C-terminal domain-containing protein [Polyangia bacterium]
MCRPQGSRRGRPVRARGSDRRRRARLRQGRQQPAGRLPGVLRPLPARPHERAARAWVITQRPRELTRQALRELQLKLAEDGYTEAQLRTAWRLAKNQDIVASILGHIRQQARGEPLVPYEERVRRAVQRLLSRGRFTDIQKQWLDRIAKKLQSECLVGRASLDEGQFQVHGGWKRLNTVFDGKLE